MDRTTIIKAVARNLGDLIVDTIPASLTGSSIDALKLIHPNPRQLQGKDFYIFTGAGAGQNRTTGSLDTANRRMFFQEVFVTMPSINSAFAVFDHWTKPDYDSAIARAIGVARIKHLETKVATLAVVGTQYEYAVPSGFEYISTLRIVPSGNTDYAADDEVERIFELAPRYWTVRPNPLGTWVIAFDARKISLDDFDEEWLNVVGQAKPVVGATDNATIPVALEEYVIADASMLLSSQRISEGVEWRNKFGIFRQLTNELEDYIFTHRHGKKVG